MFRTKSKTEQAKEQAAATAAALSAQARDRTGTLRDKVAPAVSHASEAAYAAKVWGEPRLHAAKDWGQPRVEHGIEAAKEWAKPRVEHGIEVAAPKLESAVSGLAPKVDTARDKIVDELLPRVSEAIAAVVAASLAARNEVSSAAGEAQSRGSGALSVLSGDAVASKRRGKRTALLWIAGLGAAGAAVFAFIKRSAPKDDPWATPVSDPYVPPVSTPDPVAVPVPTDADAGLVGEAAESEVVDSDGVEVGGIDLETADPVSDATADIDADTPSNEADSVSESEKRD